jgi:hypothetical protein
MECGDGTCSQSSWGFEEGTPESFVQDTIPDGGSVIVVNDPHSGTSALSSQFGASSGEQVYIGVRGPFLCGGAGLSVQGLTASAWVKLNGPFQDGTPCELEYSTDTTDIDFAAGPEVTGVPGQWIALTATITSPMIYRIKVVCFTHAFTHDTPTGGTLQMDVDDVTIE